MRVLLAIIKTGRYRTISLFPLLLPPTYLTWIEAFCITQFTILSIARKAQCGFRTLYC